MLGIVRGAVFSLLYFVFLPLFSSVTEAADNTLNFRCFQNTKAIFCYDNLEIRHIHGMTKVPQSHLALAMQSYEKVKASGFTIVGDYWRMSHICDTSTKHNMKVSIYENHSVELYLMTLPECSSFGNILGTYFDGFALGMRHNFAVGRMPFVPWSRCPGYSLGETWKDLPALMVPVSAFNTSLTSSRNCSAIYDFPWERTHSALWTEFPILGQLNSHMVHRYYARYHRHIVDSSNAVVVQFRCSDNVFHHLYGLIPFKVWKEVLSQIAVLNPKKVYIFTDAKTRGAGWGACWPLLGALEEMIMSLPHYRDHPVVINKESDAITYVMMHRALGLLCPRSTFCMVAGIGSRRVWLPQGGLLNLPLDIGERGGNVTLYTAQIATLQYHNETDGSFVHRIRSL